MCEKGELGVLVGRIRKQLSVAAVRAQADCLITRTGNVGEGTEEGKCDKVGEEVGEGDAGGNSVREARKEDHEEGPDKIGLGVIEQQTMI